MMIKKTLVLFTSIFFLAILLGNVSLASASTLELTLTSGPSEVLPGTSTDFFFTLHHNGESNLKQTGLDWTGSITPTEGGQWTNLPTLQEIDVGQTVNLKATLNVPQNAQAGTLNGLIHVDSDTGASAMLGVVVNVAEAPKLEIDVVTPITKTQNGTISVKNTGNVDLAGIDLTNLGNDDFDVTFSTNGFSLNKGQSASIIVSPTTLGTIGFGGKSASIRAEANDGTFVEKSLNIKGTFCDAGTQGASNISIASIDVNNKGDSSDSEDDVWVLTDEVKVEVDVDNLLDDDRLDNIQVELGLYDGNNNRVRDLVFDDNDEEKKDLGDIRDGDTETAIFNFVVPPDFKTGTYTLVVKAYQKSKESSLCVEETTESSIDVREENDEDRFIIVHDVQMDTQATCGETITGEFTLSNIGDEDQDRVRVTMFNKDLGIEQTFDTTNLDTGDEEVFPFTFQLPNGVQEKSYTMSFITDYDYHNGVYRLRSDRSFASSTFNVVGCGVSSGSQDISIVVPQVSNVEPGKQLVVQATITNLATSTKNLVVSPAGYQSWASLDSQSDNILTLGQGESKTVTLTFTVNKDASGSETFNINLLEGNKITSQPVEVNVNGSDEGFNLDFSGSGLIWIIAGINLILIILIIVVAVRLARR